MKYDLYYKNKFLKVKGFPYIQITKRFVSRKWYSPITIVVLMWKRMIQEKEYGNCIEWENHTNYKYKYTKPYFKKYSGILRCLVNRLNDDMKKVMGDN